MRRIVFAITSAWMMSFAAPSAGQSLKMPGPPTQVKSLHLPLEAWGAVRFRVVNTTDQDRQGFVTSFFEKQSEQQFGRRFWLPAQSARDATYLVKTPTSDGSDKESEARTLRSLLVFDQGLTESAAVGDGGKRFETSPIRCRKRAAETLVLLDADDDETRSFIQAARSPLADPGDFLITTPENLPVDASVYENWSQIVLATGKIFDDPAVVEALRQWTVRGGRLWILSHRVDLQAVPPLLGDSGRFTLVDRVGLTAIQFTSPTGRQGTTGTTQEFETPVPFVRTVAEGFDVLYEVDGWGAAFSTEAGEGSILITTLGPAGWLTDQSPAPEGRRRQAEDPAGPFPLTECVELSETYWGFEEPQPMPSMSAIATNYEGYEVTSWNLVTSLLALFCLSVLAGSFVLWKMERLMVLAWFAPLASGIATLGIGYLGYQTRTSIPPTEAAIQIAEVDQVGNVHVRGGLSIYSAADGDTSPVIADGGRLEFLHPPQGRGRRLVKTDYDQSRWENLALNTGVHEFEFETHLTRHPSMAMLSFNGEGVVGEVIGDWTLPDRGLIVSPFGTMAAPRFSEDSRLAATADDGLTAGQFSASDVINDRERTRMAAIEALFSGGDRLPAEPKLFFWTEPLDIGITTQEEGRKTGDALVGLPIRYQTPEAGGDVYCPPYLVEFVSVQHQGRGGSLAYFNRTRKWNDKLLRKSTTTLEFRLPDCLREMDLTQARLFVDLNAPNRKFQLLAFADAEDSNPKVIAERESPVRSMTFDLAGDTLPRRSQDGAIRLGLDVGPIFGKTDQEVEVDEKSHVWQFRQVWMEVWGRMPE